MFSKQYLLIFFLTLNLFVFNSCTQKTPPPPQTLSEADAYFLKVLKEDYNHTDVVIRTAGETLWIYSPGERKLFSYMIQKTTSLPQKEDFKIIYLDGFFEDNTFNIEFDIISTKKLQKNQGITSGYGEEYRKEEVNITHAITRSYLDLPQPPEFIILVFTDIKKGMEIRKTFLTNDLLRYYSFQSLTPDEYILRVVQDSSGNEAIIGDKEGNYLELKEVEWSAFLLKQILRRIKFKYENSTFRPTDSPEEIIIATTKQTLGYYKFADFKFLRLRNLRTGTTRLIGKQNLIEEKP